MKTKISVAFLFMSLFLTVTPFSFAQNSQNDWNTVQKLAMGTDVLIKTFNGKNFFGSLVSVNGNEIEVSVKGSSLVLSNNNVEAVYLAVPKTGKSARLIGGAIGLLTVVVTAGVVNRDEVSYSGSVLLPIAGFVGGVLIGSQFGKGKKRGLLIYKAK